MSEPSSGASSSRNPADGDRSATADSSIDAASTSDLSLDWLTLEPDEEVLWASRPHRSSLVPSFAVGIPLSIVLIGIPIVVSAYLTYVNTAYVATTSGLYKKTGILSRDVQKIGFGKVQNISYNQTAIGSQFGYGNVEVSTAGSSGVEMRFRNVPDPADVQELIDREIDSEDDRGETSKSDVLAKILVELQAIRRAVEVDATVIPDDTAVKPDGDATVESDDDSTDAATAREAGTFEPAEPIEPSSGESSSGESAESDDLSVSTERVEPNE